MKVRQRLFRKAQLREPLLQGEAASDRVRIRSSIRPARSGDCVVWRGVRVEHGWVKRGKAERRFRAVYPGRALGAQGSDQRAGAGDADCPEEHRSGSAPDG